MQNQEKENKMGHSRVLKFRAWDSFAKQMNEITHLRLPHREDLSPGLFLMQYTGLKDKNGKEIYEGDIVRIYDIERGCICSEWEDCEAPEDTGCEEHGEHKHEKYDDCDNFLCTQEIKFECGYVCDEDTGDYCPLLSDDSLEMEIIGNIYENQELIK